MKKLLLLFFVLFTTSSIYAQVYIIPSKELGDQFAEIYLHTNKQENYFSRMLEAARIFFSMDNKESQKAISDLRKKYHLPIDSSAGILFDSVMLRFAQDHIWDEYPSAQKEDLSFFQLYNDKLCPCINEKISSSPLKRMDEKDMANCVGSLTLDTSYINEARRRIGNRTMNEIYAISQLSGLYMFQHCKSLFQYFTDIIRDESVSMYIADIHDKFYGIDKTVTRLYSNKSPDLPLFFPAYKRYETDIKMAGAVVHKKQVLHFRNREIDPAGKLTITKTFYSYENDKPVLHGQLVYVLKEEAPDATILSMRFIVGTKMKDRDIYLARITDEEIVEPPPAMEMIREVRIDTLQKKN